MIEILEMNDENIFGLRLDGEFNAGDVRRVFKVLEEKIKGKDRIRLYYEVANIDLSGVSLKMIEDEFKWLFKNPGIISKLEKGALVTDSEWLKRAFTVEQALIPTLTGKSFSTVEKDEALEWLKKDHRAEMQIDMVLPELVEFGAVKGLGGFGLGLLAANYFSKNERKHLGLITLGISCALGIPLAIKVLINNRRLLSK